MEGGRREDVFTTLGMCVLTSRSCDMRDGSHTTETRKTAHRQSLPETEVFVPITEEVCDSIHTAPACINSCKITGIFPRSPSVSIETAWAMAIKYV